MALLQAIVTLLLVMDPLGNVPLFLSVLKAVEPARRRKVLLREIAFAYLVLAAFVVVGDTLMRVVGLEQPAISLAGGIVLFLIALRMVFPSDSGLRHPQVDGEPFFVPLAVPLIAGPSALATLLLLRSAGHYSTLLLLGALTIAWAMTAVVLISSTVLYRVLGERGLTAVERLMGMLLVMVAVQMLLNGVRVFLDH